MEKQSNLMGKVVGDEESLKEHERRQVSVWKSALQKYIRRGMVEKAMYAAYRLSTKKTGWIMWRRLNIIAVEDCLDANVVSAVSELSRQARYFKYDTWDGKRCAVAAALLMAESEKDRRADEFLELMDAIEKNGDKTELLSEYAATLTKTDDFVFDMHTFKGRKMGRGNLFWYEVSSETENKKDAYSIWRDWFKPLMVKVLEQRKEVK